MTPSLDLERTTVMDNPWLNYLDELAEEAAIEIIGDQGTEPEYITYHEVVSDIVAENGLDDEDAEYLLKELERLVTTAEVTIQLKRNGVRKL